MIGSKRLHEDCSIIAAGNKATDGAIVNKTGTAMQSRMIHFELEPSKDGWIDWANANGIDFRISAYVNFKPSVLTSFDPKHTDHTFTCGRTLEFASDLIKGCKELNHDDLTILAGTIGEGNAKEFYGFCSIFEELPTIASIIKDPDNAKLKNDPSFMYGISSFVAEHMTEDNIEQLMRYLLRFKPEFQVIAARQAYRSNNNLIDNKHMIGWLDKISIYL